MSQKPITEWLVRYRNGESEAANQLWKSYYEQLITLAKGRLRGSRNRVADEEDLVVNAFDSFFRGVDAGRFPKLEDRDDLWQILVMLTTRKAANQLKHENRAKRGGGRVRGESLFEGVSDSSQPAGLEELGHANPSPEFADAIIEQCGELLDLLGDEGALREIATHKLEGFTNIEIAEKLGLNPRTVDRKLRLIREIFSSVE